MLNILKTLLSFSNKASLRKNHAKSQSDVFNLEDVKLSAKKTTKIKHGACGFDICGLYCGCCENMCGC